MATFIEMVNDILDDFTNEAITSANAKDAINTAIRHYERRRFWFNEMTATFMTVANQEYYSSTDLAAIPDMVEILTMLLTTDLGTFVSSGFWDDGFISSGTSGKSVLVATAWDAIETAQTGSIIGMPSRFSYYNKNIRLFPAPDTAYVIRVSFITKHSTLSADSDENEWTTDAYEMIKQAAKRRLALNKLMAPDLADMAAGLEQEAFGELLAETRRRRPNKRLVTPDLVTSTAFDITTGM